MRELKIIGLLVASLCFLFASEVKSQNTDYKRPPQEMVSLTNVVYSGIGEFKMVDKKLWTNTKTKQRFKETHRDPWSIFLVEEKGGKKLFLDLYQGKVRPNIASIKSSNVLWAPLLINYKNVSACGSYPKPKQEDVSSISYMEVKTGSNRKVVFEQTSADVWKVGNAKLKERERRDWSIFLRKTIAVGTLDYRFDLHKGQVFMRVDNGQEFLVGCMAKATKDNKGNTGNFEPMTFTEQDINNSSILGNRIPQLDNPIPPSNAEENIGWSMTSMMNDLNVNVNGLGRCYDVRNLNVLNWASETLNSRKAAYVFDLQPDTDGDRVNNTGKVNGKDKIIPKNTTFSSNIEALSSETVEFVVSGHEFQTKVAQKYSADIGVKGIVSASGSIAFENTSGGSSRNENLYAYNTMNKKMYKLDLTNLNNGKHAPRNRFWYGVHKLGYTISANEFIKNFGTHFASSTTYGGNYLHRRSVSKSSYATYIGSEKQFQADIQATIKGITGSLSTEVKNESVSENFKESYLSNTESFTVGGNATIENPKRWAETVEGNPEVIDAYLTSIATLLTKDNFPDIKNIDNKRKLLEVAIKKAIKEAKKKVVQPTPHNFFERSPMTFKITVWNIKCLSQGSSEPGDESEYYGDIAMGFFDRNRGRFKMKNVWTKGEDNTDSFTTNQSKKINQSIEMTVYPINFEKGFAKVWGWMKEDDSPDTSLSAYDEISTDGSIPYRSTLTLGKPVTQQLSFTSSAGDIVTVYYELERVK